MKAEIISIGTELLLGEITDTNASYVAGQLPPLGIDLYWITQVGDNKARLVEALRRAWSRSDLILTIGGLGPTDDDLTREAIAELLGEGLSVDPELERWLRGVFHRLGLDMPERNLKQVTLIPSAQSIPNPWGTAPGWWVEKEGRIIIALPGPPKELKRMWEEKVSPKLRQRCGEAIILSRTLKTWGLSEAKVDELVCHLLPSPNPTLAIYAKSDGIHLRITAKASGKEEAEAMIARMEKEVRPLLEGNIWGIDDNTLPGIVGAQLEGKGLSLAIMESGTGGLLATILTDTPCDYFKGGIVAHSDEAKIKFGVDAALIARHSAISGEVAEAMAEAVRSLFGADVGMGITAVVDALEAKGKPIGTAYIAIATERGNKSIPALYPGPWVKERISCGALFELRRSLLP
jgi:nicotinamide-nucleotide amidase